ncbi:MAG: hypothetical protein K0S09_1204 [Sphingobacteriaceae bacterium]|jgi:hypothetical protein|nr:hypothetical protein [Sphingobacteriaceae bacterium]
MDREVYFREKQRFNSWGILLTLVAASLLLFIGLYRQLVLGKPFGHLGNHPASSAQTIIAIFVVLSITAFLLSSKLDTVIRGDGVYVKFFPFHWSYRCYAWEDISKCYVRQYSPMAEYGGWGLRLGFRRGRAFNMSGNTGLQLEFSNGARLLIGTQMPDELTRALSQTGHLTD